MCSQAMRRISARGYGTRPVKGFTKSKCIGFSILALINIIFIFLVLIHAPNHPSRDTITANLERNKWAPKIHKMSLPLPEDPAIHGIAKEIHKMSLPLPEDPAIHGIAKEIHKMSLPLPEDPAIHG
eukprot:763211_1